MGVQIQGDTGNVIATKGTYSGNVTIGGTLTYEDVTNIDSVGLITAREGIEIGASPGVGASISVDGNAIFSGITTATTLRAPTGIVTSLEATTGDITTLRAPTGIVTTFVTNTAKVGAAVTITESGIEASGIGITCANINGTQIGGRRNLIINGAMMVAQRGTTSTSAAYQTVDRLDVNNGGVDETPTQAQVDVSSGTSPYTEGFRKALKVTNGNQTGGAGAGDNIIIRYKIEAQDIANSGWNYTSASSFITLSFWLKSSVAQEFQISLQSVDGSAYVYPTETPSLTADTWTKVTKTIPGNSNLTFNNDNGEGFRIIIVAYCGSSYANDSATINAWNSYASGIQFGRASTSTWYTTNDATLELTGLQFEVGSQATAFEHRSDGEELRLCQRYFYKNTDSPVGMFVADGADSTQSYGFLRFPVAMRTTPTVVLADNNGNTDGKVTQHGASHDIAATASQIQKEGFTRCTNTSSTWNTSSARPIVAGVTSADAEL